MLENQMQKWTLDLPLDLIPLKVQEVEERKPQNSSEENESKGKENTLGDQSQKLTLDETL